jgi:hypothetical protein
MCLCASPQALTKEQDKAARSALGAGDDGIVRDFFEKPGSNVKKESVTYPVVMEA